MTSPYVTDNLVGMDLHRLADQRFLDAAFPLPLDQPFTAETARRAGLTGRNLTWLVECGLLRRPVRNVYVASQTADSTALRCQMLALVVPEDAVVCDRHAAWLHGAEMALAPNEHTDLQPISVFLPAGRGRLRLGLAESGERTFGPDAVVEIHGVRMTSPIRTAWDLGMVRSRDQAIAGLDAMLSLGQFTKDHLLAGIDRFAGRRWVRTLREIAPLADGRAQSQGESILRLRWHDVGLPTPELQVEVWRDGVLLAILDIAHEELRFAAEYDGHAWHGSDVQQRHDRARRAAVEAEQWVVRPFVAANVFGPTRDVEAGLLHGAEEARRRFGHPRAS